MGIFSKISNKTPTEQLQINQLGKQLSAVLEVSESIAGFIDIEDVLHLILYQLGQNLGYKHPAIFLVDEAQKKLVTRKINVNSSFEALIKTFFGKAYSDIYFPFDEKENIMIKAAMTKDLLVTQNVYDFARPFINSTQASVMQKALNTKLMIAVPLLLRNKVIGVLGASFKRSVIYDYEKAVLRTFANQISIALYNAQLFDKLQGQIKAYDAQAKDLRALFEIVKTTTETLDFGTVGQQVVDSIPSNLKHLGFIGGILTIMNWETRMNKAFAVTNIPLISQAQRMLEKPFLEHEAQVDISESASSRSIRERRLIVTSDFSDLVSQSALPKVTANAMQSLVGMKAGAAVPIIVREKILGSLIFLLDKSIAEITDRDKELMNSFASQVGVGMENARLYVTEKERAAKLNEVNQELVRIDNIKSEFLSIASHQLRTPLSGIKGYLSMLKAGDFGPIPKQQDEVVDIVYENTNRLIQLVSDFLNVSRIEGGRLKVEILKVKLKDIVTNIVKELEPIAEPKHIRLIVTPSSVWPLVKADPTKMTEVFSNLIDNAIKYTPQGYVEISTEIKRPDLIIKIRDTGVGISPEEITQLFQKFSRGKNSNKINTSGSGIGLYVVKNLLKVQNADVWVESAGEGQGSTFFVRVPLV